MSSRLMSSRASAVDDVNDDPADVIMDNIDEQLSRVRPKHQVGIPMQSPRRQQRHDSDNRLGSVNVDVTLSSRDTRLLPPSPADSRKRTDAGPTTEGGDDTGLGSVSFDGDQSDLELDLDLEPDQDHDDEYIDSERGAMGDESSHSSSRRRLMLVDDAIERQIETRFRETMANIAGEVQLKQRQFDLESVRTDDFESEFQKTLINPDHRPAVNSSHSIGRGESMRRSSRRQHEPSAASQENIELTMTTAAATAIDDTDAMSVKTEDFEVQFMRTMPSGSVKQVANTPVSKFDQFIVDSDVDTVKSQSVRDTFQSALSRHELASRSNQADQRLSSTLPRRTPTTRRKRESSPSSDIEADYDNHRSPVRPSKALQADIERWKNSVQTRDQQHLVTPNRKPPKASGVRRAVSSVNVSSSRTKSSTVALENKVDFEVSSRLKQELTKIQNEIKVALQNKQALQQTNDKLQSLAAQSHLEILNIERQLKESRTAAENVRAELMLGDFKRDASRKELEVLTAEIDNRRLQLQRLAVQEKIAAEQQVKPATTKDSVDAATVTTATASAAATAAEDASERQRLDDALSESRLVNEQITAELSVFKEHFEKLQQELDASKRLVAELNEEKKRFEFQVSELEESRQQVEQEKRILVQKKTLEQDAIRAEFEGQLESHKEKSTKEITRLLEEIEELNNQLRTNEFEQQKRTADNQRLREQLNEQEIELEKLNQRQAQLIDDNMRSLRGIIKEKEAAIKDMSERAEEEKNAALDEVCRSLKTDHQRQLQEQEREFNNHLAAMQGQLTGKDLELQVLRDRVTELDEWLSQMNSRVQEEAYGKLQTTLRDERSQWDAEKEAEITAQMESMKEEMVVSGRQLREELQQERSASLSYKRHIEMLQEELEKARQTSRIAHREALQAAQRDDTMIATLNHMQPNEKRRYQEQLQITTDKLNDVVRKQKDEIDRLRRDNRELQDHMDERQSTNDKFDRKLLDELNEQSDRMTQYLNAKLSTYSSMSAANWSSSKHRYGGGGDCQASLLTVVVSLKTSWDKVLEILSQQQRDIEAHRKAISKLTSEAKDDVDQVRKQQQEEKQQALEALKTRLVQDHLEEVQKLHNCLGKGKGINQALRDKDRELQEIQRNMKAWKEQTLAKLANKFREEMNKELARRQAKSKSAEENQENIPRSVNVQALNKSTSALRENSVTFRPGYNPSSLRFKTATSVPDLSAAVSGVTTEKDVRSVAGRSEQQQQQPPPASGNGDLVHLRQLQLQLQRAESKWKMSDERARSNEHLLNQKLVEISKLQSVVAKQSKDLAQLQRTYGKLQATSGNIH